MISPWHLWSEVAFVLFLVAAGFALGRWFGRRRSPVWVIGYVVPLVLVVLLTVGRRFPPLAEREPWATLLAPPTVFCAYALGVTVLLTTPLARLPHRGQRRLIGFLAVVAVLYLAVVPVVGPAVLYGSHAALTNELDADGVCLQGDGYTCGPASAVTALRLLGFDARIGDLALLGYTTPLHGTSEYDLGLAIEAVTSGAVDVEVHRLRSARQLERGPSEVWIAVIELNLLLHHYVVVLDVTQDAVVVGDPLEGRRSWDRKTFERKWTKGAIRLRRRSGTP